MAVKVNGNDNEQGQSRKPPQQLTIFHLKHKTLVPPKGQSSFSLKAVYKNVRNEVEDDFNVTFVCCAAVAHC